MCGKVEKQDYQISKQQAQENIIVFLCFLHFTAFRNYELSAFSNNVVVWCHFKTKQRTVINVMWLYKKSALNNEQLKCKSSINHWPLVAFKKCFCNKSIEFRKLRFHCATVMESKDWIFYFYILSLKYLLCT